MWPVVVFKVLCLLLVAVPAAGQHYSIRIENEAYYIDAATSGFRVTEKATGLQRLLKPALQLAWTDKDPGLEYKQATNKLSPQASWIELHAKEPQRTADFYKSAIFRSVTAFRVASSGKNALEFSFRPLPEAAMRMLVVLPEGKLAPVIQVSWVAKKAGWFSGGFTGINPVDTSSLAFLYQPLIWSWRRFPDQSYMTAENYATTAACFVNNSHYTEGVTADPQEIPYRFANLQNSRFGLMLRNKMGLAQPMLFAPLLGGESSYMVPGRHYSFTSRYVLKTGDWYAGMHYIFRDIFRYRTERRNATVTLNQTIDNMIELAKNDLYGGWNDSLKGFRYDQDAVGTVKVVSAMHQLGAALVTGSEDLYKRRALPTIGYLMSREKYLFTDNEAQKTQQPSYTLNGPCAEVGELSGLFQMTRGRNEVFRKEMDRIFGKVRKLNLDTESGGASWQDYLYRYRVTQQADDLKKAIAGADEYLKNWLAYPSVFSNDPGLRDKSAAFLTDFAPRLYDLTELFEETGYQRYLDMALLGARQMLLWTRSNPLTPDSIIKVNVGGYAKGFIGKRYKLNSYDFLPGFNDTTRIQEEEVEAWQTSLVGLAPEQPNTYMFGPIMLAHHAAWFLRLAHLGKDSLLRDAAYNAIIGRYAGFPGYYFTSFHTNVYQKADYVKRSYMDIRYNAIFYNHLFPHITLLIDFLVNDARLRSAGQVDFPGIYAPGYAFLTSQVYGTHTGSIYGHKGIRLWLPSNALKSSGISLNHLLGVAEKDFFVVLMNASDSLVEETISLNRDIIPWVPKRKYQVTAYFTDGSSKELTMENGVLQVCLGQQQLVAYRIRDLKIRIPFSVGENVLTGSRDSGMGFVRDDQAGPFGIIEGMLLGVDSRFSDAYLFTNASRKDFNEIRCRYRINGGDWLEKLDTRYPYEFDIPMDNNDADLEFQMIGVRHDGQTIQSRLYSLKNRK